MKQSVKGTGIAWLITSMEQKGIAIDSKLGKHIFSEYKRINAELLQEGIRNVRTN